MILGAIGPVASVQVTAGGGGGGPLSWAQTVTGLGAISNATNSTCRLNATTIAITSQSDETLRAYTRSTYAKRGSSQSIGGTLTSDNVISRLVDNELIVSRNGSVFQKYVWDDGASTWSTDGGTINLGNDTVVVGVSSTRFFAIRTSGAAGLYCYDLSGGSWSHTGTLRAVTTSLRRQAICALVRTNNAEVIVYRTYQTGAGSTAELHAVSFNGSTFSSIDTLNLGSLSDSFPSLASMSVSGFAMLGNINKTLAYYTLISSTLAVVAGATADLSADNSPHIGELDGNTIAVAEIGGSSSRYGLQEYTYS